VRKTPNPNADSLATLKPGAYIIEAARTQDNQWVMYRKPEAKLELWVHAVTHTGRKVVEQVSQGLFWRVLRVVNARKTPTLKGSKLDTVPEGAIVEELERNGEWIRTKHGWSATFDQ